MSIRIAILTVLVVALAVYAWRDWFVSLCGLILLMAVIQHPDMPKNIMEIQGLNPWNVLMLSILLAWTVHRRREGLVWDLPRYISVMLVLYLLVVLAGLVRLLADRSYLDAFPLGYLISENLINTVKWVIPSVVLFDACRTRKRIVTGLIVVLIVYFLLALQVIRWVPVSAAASGSDLSHEALRAVENEIGYSRVNMSMLLSGASWAILATLPFVRQLRSRLAIIAAFLAVAYGQALTGGRMGYITWGVVGLILCLIKWRRYLALVPVVPIIITILLPGVAERMLQGFGQTDASGQAVVDDYRVTAGRTQIWPHVIDKIMESPLVGYGRMAMVRTGLRDFLGATYGEAEAFPHPHNAYLEWLLDNGLVGFALVMPFYGIILFQGIRLFLDRADPLRAAVGGATCALMLALLVASFGSQTFYPREGAVGMWCMMGLTLRLSMHPVRALAASQAWVPGRAGRAIRLRQLGYG